jgi:hypothetical protein
MKIISEAKCLFLTLILCTSFNVYSQNISLDETVEYLNNKIISQFIIYERLKVSDGGTVIAEVGNSPAYIDPTLYTFDLKKVKIKEVTDGGPRGLGKWLIYFECDDLDCVKIAFSKNSGVKNVSGYSIYYNDYEDAIKSHKAFKYLQSLARNYKDPFGQ